MRLNLLRMGSVLKRNLSTERNVLELRSSKLFEDIFPHESRTEAAELLKSGSQCVYAGFDPTADSLHVGNLLILVNLLHWQRAGHKPIALVGGATGLIGDPSGRTTDRPELAQQKVEENLAGIKKNIETIFKNHQECILKKQSRSSENLKPVVVVNNLSWYKDQDLVYFISHYGRHFRLGQMLSRHSVQSRLTSEQGINFTEFSYQVFQAYDWLHLNQAHGCRFQIGGNDQMGNMVSGHELISKVENKKVYGLTLPLIVSESGSKFGKSAGNAVWLNAEKTTPFELYQFFVRNPDSTVENLLNQFTFLSDEEIEHTMLKHKEATENRYAQQILAEQVTLLVHGEKGLHSAQLATDVLFKGNLDSLEQLTKEEVIKLFAGATLCTLKPQKTRSILEFALDAKCFKTEKDARNKIAAGALHINMRKVNDPDMVFKVEDHLLKNGTTLIRIGKKNYYIISWDANS